MLRPAGILKEEDFLQILDVSGPGMAFLALIIYVLYDAVRTAQLGVAGARPPRAAARARDRKVGKFSNTSK